MNFKEITKTQWGFALALLAAMLITIVLLLQETIMIAFPVGDEFALIVESLESPVNWVLNGYSNYFRVYGEYFLPYTNFIRPVANFLYFVFSFTPSPMSYQLVFVNYLAHSLTCTLIYLLSLSFRNSNSFSLALVTAAFLAPAFWLTPITSHPSFALDVLATLFCLLSLAALLKGYYFFGLLCLLAGVFTKETALPISLVWVFFGIQRKNSQTIWFGFLALSLWFAFRLMAFDSVSGGTYSFNEFTIERLLIRFSSLATLPLGSFSIQILKDFITDQKLSMDIFYLLVNIIAWILSLKIFLKSKVNLFNLAHFFKNSSDLQIIFIALIGSISLYAIIGGSVRFSYLTFALWLIVLSAVKKSLERSLIVVLFICSSIVSFPAEKMQVSEVNKFRYDQSRLFVDFLGASDYSANTYVFNDFISGYSQQKYIATYSGSSSNFFRGSSISLGACNTTDFNLIRSNLVEDKTGKKLLQIEIPSCASFQFEGAQTGIILENIKDKLLLRNDDVRYRFRDLIIKKSFTGAPLIDFGKYMEVEVSPGTNVLFFDFATNKWMFHK
jgi:hypothetical protein